MPHIATHLIFLEFSQFSVNKGKIRVVYTSRERRQHSEKCVPKLTPLKCCALPSSMEHFKCPSGVGLPIGTKSSWPPLFGYRKNAVKKKMGTGVPPVFAFSTKLSKNSGRCRRPYKKMENLLFLSIWEGGFIPLFCLFFVIFYEGLFSPPGYNAAGSGRPPHFSQPPARAWCAIAF